MRPWGGVTVTAKHWALRTMGVTIWMWRHFWEGPGPHRPLRPHPVSFKNSSSALFHLFGLKEGPSWKACRDFGSLSHISGEAFIHFCHTVIRTVPYESFCCVKPRRFDFLLLCIRRASVVVSKVSDTRLSSAWPSRLDALSALMFNVCVSCWCSGVFTSELMCLQFSVAVILSE